MTLIEDTRARLGAVGAWLPSAPMAPPPDVERAATQRLAEAGYRSVWSGEGPGTREVFACFGDLLATVPDVVLGAGIANLWARRGTTAQKGGATLAQAHPGRFVLGIGAGHAFQAAKLGEEYRPLNRMRAYLSEMDATAAENPSPVAFPRVLAAVGPKMLELVRDHADGAHPFAQPVSHTPYAREILGPDKLLIPQQTVLLGTREDARESVRHRVAQSREYSVTVYLAGWKRLGYTEADIAGPSDRFVDDLVLWGDATTIAKRLGELLDAGADHVLLTPAAPSFESTVEILLDLAVAVTR
ncbi:MULTISPECIES: TIGR03620 family F420-dependent LLM class oxidoreductase [unclassified Amycolatopsis]|uniref:TIGR03620 family F420-dependent LLM class oxidoreductase n=1 Tax=unclassified Amycolatopsis TaxID=2618356 RepID=UPI002875B39B|nr:MULTISPECIES: TIGR03620 family F420-dependent LLM class oxidoreductase [unclassified Amycolatopsis]MDS0138212.1 TIGR03620 family F420-dependent LLM class oxidoreductase [Amycolatopsis sp. 505]MDS0149167.1 TIGR03620 family F420-dependent LLM class oxidoreductase [Amycolatopsis sp. CM201R]